MSDQQRQFIGEYAHQLDAANRLVIPAKWRTGKSEDFCLIVRGEAGSISALTKTELGKITHGIDSDPRLSPKEKRAKRLPFSTALMATCDRQGRITLDAVLLKKAGLREKVVLVGMIERFEIWSTEAWERKRPQLESDHTATLDELGI